MTTPQSEKSQRALALKHESVKPNPATIFGGERLISRAELRHFVTASDMALWRWLQAKKFPPPIYIGTRRYWRQSEVEKWLEQRSAAS